MLNCVLIFMDMSGGEMVVIAIVALLVLGPQKMGDFARKAGKMMSEVKRVSSDFTSQLKEEAGPLNDEVRSIRDSLKSAANNIKDEFNNQNQEIKKNLDPDLPNINEPSNDVFNISKDSTDKETETESHIEGISSEQSEKQHVIKEEQVDKNPSSKQENQTNP